jgi:hypothetical protein
VSVGSLCPYVGTPQPSTTVRSGEMGNINSEILNSYSSDLNQGSESSYSPLISACSMNDLNKVRTIFLSDQRSSPNEVGQVRDDLFVWIRSLNGLFYRTGTLF